MNTQMIEVECEEIDAVGYDESLKELYVKFKDRAVNKFEDIDLNIFTELLYAKSKKSFVQKKLYDKRSFSIILS